MATALGVSVEEYLNTAYRPDCDFVDGEVQERNVGETDHSNLQALLVHYLMGQRRKWNLSVLPEQRVQVRPGKFRVPDIALVEGPLPETRILLAPPLVCIEILSRDDRMERMQERIDDYLEFGVPCVWVLNPRTRKGFIYTVDGMKEAKDGILRAPNTPIAVPFAELE